MKEQTLLMYHRRLTRDGLEWWMDMATRGGGGWGCYNTTEKCHDCTAFEEKYGLIWRVFPSDRSFLKHMEEVFDHFKKDGWTETECSLSRRIFVNPDLGSGKFWILSLSGLKHHIHFGRIPKLPGHWGVQYGQWAEKTFKTPEDAIAAYHKLIEKKRREGYVEVYPRKTQYSRPSRTSKGL